jgi:hypothetical protein
LPTLHGPTPKEIPPNTFDDDVDGGLGTGAAAAVVGSTVVVILITDVAGAGTPPVDVGVLVSGIRPTSPLDAGVELGSPLTG